MRQIILLALMLVVMNGTAQNHTEGGYDFTKSNNLDKQGKARTQQYRPENGAFVCENGQNRYTRALYGGHTRWRIDTSDRPIFAVVDKESRNFSFKIDYAGRTIALDSTDYCRASYHDGLREYVLRDDIWGQGELHLTVVARADAEAALWRFEANGFTGLVNVTAQVRQISAKKLYRNGDIGAEPAGSLEPKGEVLQQVTLALVEGDNYMQVEGIQVSVLTPEAGRQSFEAACQYFHELAQRVTFQTPDPYFNPLGGALVLAADGAWDGQTWLHGAVGWRTPLAGWRAGYLGDMLGWQDRAVSHFNAYAKSQVTNVPATIPHPTQDAEMNRTRAEKKWGTQMYSNGYICRLPERNDVMHHYDMNLNFVDELLTHFQYDATPDYLRKMWPLLKRHLEWEKRNYDPDGDHLYDAYCCIWASDALYYSGSAVTHSSAYNYRGNHLAARIAELLGEDPQPYRQEADAILNAMNRELWMQDKGVWAEYKDLMGRQRRHEHPALWTVYTPIDCEACSPQQAYWATRYVDDNIPHLDVEQTGYQVVSTSDWLPYAWSINNVAAAEIMHMALAYFMAGRGDAGYRLLKGSILDQMYFGASPANFGQVSYYDAARGECYRDFSDCTGVAARTLIQGLFGIQPDALNNRCVLRPGFPEVWDSASISTPYITYKYLRKNGKVTIDVTQHFAQPLKMVLRLNLGEGRYRDIEGTAEEHQIITVDVPETIADPAPRYQSAELSTDSLGLSEPDVTKRMVCQNLSKWFNAEVDDIFEQQYLSPRPQVTTLQIPVQGIGEWCHPQQKATINDSVFRTLIQKDVFTVAGVPFRTPKEGKNIVYTSLWDNYPNEVTLPLKGQASAANLMMAGSTNHMQSRIENGMIIVTYQDGTSSEMPLINPLNWCPIEQDYYVDGKAFLAAAIRPYRICLGKGTVSRDLGKALGIEGVYGREIPGGGATMLRMPLNPQKKLKSLTIRTLSNDVVIGLMGITLEQ